MVENQLLGQVEEMEDQVIVLQGEVSQVTVLKGGVSRSAGRVIVFPGSFI